MSAPTPPESPESNAGSDPLELTPAQQRFVLELLQRAARWALRLLRHPHTAAALFTVAASVGGMKWCTGPAPSAATTAAIAVQVAKLAAHDTLQDREREVMREGQTRIENKLDATDHKLDASIRIGCRGLAPTERELVDVCAPAAAPSALPARRMAPPDGTHTRAPRALFVTRSGEVTP